MEGGSDLDSGRPIRVFLIHGGNRGTTATIAEHIVQGIEQEGAEAVAMPISLARMVPNRVDSADIIGIGSPVYFLREPPDVTRYVSSLPSLEGKKAFVYCTCGMDRPGETLFRLASLLRARGAEIVGTSRYRTAMSYFPYWKRGLGNPDTFPDESELAAAREFGARMASARTLPPIEIESVSRLVRWKARLLATRRFRRTFFPGVKLLAPACTDYGSCLSRCTIEAIVRPDGAEIPEVSPDCIQCLECVSYCPRAAIVPDSAFKEWLSTLGYRLGIH